MTLLPQNTIHLSLNHPLCQLWPGDEPDDPRCDCHKGTESDAVPCQRLALWRVSDYLPWIWADCRTEVTREDAEELLRGEWELKGVPARDVSTTEAKVEALRLLRQAGEEPYYDVSVFDISLEPIEHFHLRRQGGVELELWRPGIRGKKTVVGLCAEKTWPSLDEAITDFTEGGQLPLITDKEAA